MTLFGPPSVHHLDGSPVTHSLGAKALALLAYLVIEYRPHTREELAALLWSESPEAEARASLRQVLMRLREVLGEGLGCDRRVVQLTEPIPCDAADFLREVEREPDRALAVDVSRFLAGFSVRHAPLFDDWLSQTRERLLRKYRQALAALTRSAMGEWRWREAAELADRWLESDRLSEEAIHLAVEARYLAGDRGAALARFADYRAMLLRETGTEPSRKLLALYHRVEADRTGSSARPITDEWYARAPSFHASLIGREPEWEAMVQAWKAVSQGAGRVLLIEGEAGVGKSRLAEEFFRWCLAEGGTVLKGRGYDARASNPYETLAEVLRDALQAPGLAGAAPEWLMETARLVPELRERFPTIPPLAPPVETSDAWRLHEGIAQVVAAVAAERPLVVSIDDLHWCDGDSCNLLRFLTRRLERSPVLWVMTLTLGELERDVPAARLCRALRARAHAQTISLGPLNEEQMWRLVREMGHVSSPKGARRFASRIFRISSGNPFYAIELLKTMFAQGLLAVDEHTGEWTVSSAGVAEGTEFPVSQTVHDVIAERVERLPEELNDVLITIAVSRSGCRPATLSHIHGISRLHAASVGDALVERRLAVEEGGVYRCAHPVIAHVVRDGMTASRRREVHRVLALVLDLITPREEARAIAGEIARHADAGGEPGLAYRYALIASEGAVQRYAFEEALSWLDLAASSARSEPEAATVNRLTAELLERAGWSESQLPARPSEPITRELVTEDLDLAVREPPSDSPSDRPRGEGAHAGPPSRGR